jgi:hypothetical protein
MGFSVVLNILVKREILPLEIVLPQAIYPVTRLKAVPL